MRKIAAGSALAPAKNALCNAVLSHFCRMQDQDFLTFPDPV